MGFNVLDSIDFVKEADNEIGKYIDKELQRQSRNLELIASENIVSEAVLATMGSILTNKYAEGYPHKRYYGGCCCVDEIEEIAISRAKELFGAEHVNVQPHSGAQANLAVYFSLLEPGDTVMGMDLSEGGHLTHGSQVNISGKYYNFVKYGVDSKTHLMNYDMIMNIAKSVRPKLIVCGASAYPRMIDFKKFRKIADEVGAYLMVDMAHIAGLVAAGIHESPIPYADFVTSTTHKTLRGPRGGIIICKKQYAKQIDKSIFPGTQGGPLMHIIAAKAVCFGEALKPEFKEYQKNVVENCKTIANRLIDNGINLVSGGTDNHLLLIDLRGTDITGKELEKRLDNVYITVNKNTVPSEPLSPFITSGIRVGTAAVTSRGLGKKEMIKIADLITLSIKDYDNNVANIKREVNDICEQYPIYR